LLTRAVLKETIRAIMNGLTLPAFYPVLDTSLAARCGLTLLDAAEAILEGGARILQLRHKGFFGRDLFQAAERIARLCEQAGAMFVMNDRADMARLVGAELHLGQDDLTPADARKVVGSGVVIGFSTHNESQLRAASAEPVDYVALGPVFVTGSKANPDPVLGVEELRRLRPISNRGLVAIGGITRATAQQVLAAGADSVAVIGDLFPETGAREGLRARTEEWLRLLSK
jgi:thiamine-phosphate pyrophosphorylase